MKCLEIKNKTDTEAELSIYGDIVDDAWKGWDWGKDSSIYPTDIKDMLKDVKGKNLAVHINSGGGDVFAGVAIANMIRQHDGKTQCIVDGLCASIATQIALSCDSVEMPENAYFMIHRPWGGARGTASDMRHTADLLDKIQSTMEATYMEHARDGVTPEQIHEMVDAETWLTGKEAADVFNITLDQPVEAAACMGSYAEQLKNRPQNLRIINLAEEAGKQKELQEKASAEIDIALALLD